MCLGEGREKREHEFKWECFFVMFLTALAWKRLMQGRDGLSLYGRVNNAMETLFCCHTVHVSRSQIPRSPVADSFSSHLLCPPQSLAAMSVLSRSRGFPGLRSGGS